MKKDAERETMARLGTKGNIAASKDSGVHNVELTRCVQLCGLYNHVDYLFTLVCIVQPKLFIHIQTDFFPRYRQLHAQHTGDY